MTSPSRRHRRDSTVELSRVVAAQCVMNLQFTTTADGFGGKKWKLDKIWVKKNIFYGRPYVRILQKAAEITRLFTDSSNSSIRVLSTALNTCLFLRLSIGRLDHIESTACEWVQILNFFARTTREQFWNIITVPRDYTTIRKLQQCVYESHWKEISAQPSGVARNLRQGVCKLRSSSPSCPFLFLPSSPFPSPFPSCSFPLPFPSFLPLPLRSRPP